VESYTSVEDALSAILAKEKAQPRTEKVPVRKSYGRICAREVTSPVDVPSSATSHMDGYAVVAEDLKGASKSNPVRLQLVGEAGPAERPKRRISSGAAWQVATGAHLPPGADAVVPREHAKVDGREVLLTLAPKPGDFVYGAGEDVRKGEAVLTRGRPIRAQHVGLMITLGLGQVEVLRKPRVSVMATGSELTADLRPGAGKIRESHSPVFLRLCEASGCIPINAGIVPDDTKALSTALRKALAGSDFVITLGGTSAGKRDFIVDAVSTLEPDVVVHGIKLDRGRVTGMASVRGKPILMLPGPIQAAMNAFLVLGTPIIGTLAGGSAIEMKTVCRLDKPWEARRRFSDFQKVFYVKIHGGEGAVATPISAETESLKLLADADGYVVVPTAVTRIDEGSLVTVRLFPGFSYV
jgi:molybdopterin molybdotransferase